MWRLHRSQLSIPASAMLTVPHHYTFSHKPCTLHPQPYTLNPKPAQVMVSPGVGLLVQRPRFNFGNAKAGGVSSVDFFLRLGESLVGGDRVEVVMGGFGGEAGSVDGLTSGQISTQNVDLLVDGYSSAGFLLANVTSSENATTVVIQVLFFSMTLEPRLE